jgi:beta-carotene 3-hydroxylase
MKVLAGILAGFPAMELAAWAAHKWIMHGPLWILHRSHHRDRKGALEANDGFGLFFAAISIFLIWKGVHGRPIRLGLGIGMALYGLAYLWVHDALTHGRFGRCKPPANVYLLRLMRAHRTHHSRDARDGTRNFGFLWLPESARRARQGRISSEPTLAYARGNVLFKGSIKEAPCSLPSDRLS